MGLWHVSEGEYWLLSFVPLGLIFIAGFVDLAARQRHQKPRPWIFIIAALVFLISSFILHKANLLYIVPGAHTGLIHAPLQRLTPEALTPAQADHVAWTTNIGFAVTVAALLFLFKSMGASPKALAIGMAVAAMVVVLYRHVVVG